MRRGKRHRQGQESLVARPVTASRIVSWWIRQLRDVGVEPDQATIGHMGRQIKTLLAAGETPRAIALGLRLMRRKEATDPRLLPSFVREAQEIEQ